VPNESRIEGPATSEEAGEALSSEKRASYLGFSAHEIRNPLSTALWSAELLARLPSEERGGPRGEKLAGMCLRALRRMRVLVEDHFLAERLAVGGMPLRPESVALAEALAAIAGKAGAAHLVLDLPAGLAVWADRGMLERALEAVLAAAARGDAAVRVEGGRSGREVELRVKGDPPAPDALALPQKGTPSDASGRALALYTARRVLASLGGTLSSTADAYLLALPAVPTE
jgi:signal transduction histidine kinase